LKADRTGSALLRADHRAAGLSGERISIMGYERNDRGYRYGRDYGRDYSRDARSDRGRYDPEDRGFFDRAGDEVRSWFGDEEAERRRRMDERFDERYDREHGYSNDRYGYGHDTDRDRYASRTVGGYRSPDRYPSWSRSNAAEGYSRGYTPSSRSYPATGEDRQFEGGYPGDGSYGRRSYADTGYRYAGDDGWRTSDEDYRAAYGRRGSSNYGYGRNRDEDRTGYGSGDDVHGYRNWRDSQINSFDRDYDEYRRENQTRFQSEFATWRQNRQTQRDSLGTVKEHQEIVGSDGAHVGTVDHVRGDRILLTKNDKDAGGHHHSIPSSWIATVADKVTLSKTAAQAQQAWRDEESNRGLFGGARTDDRDDDRTGLNRSFSGTY
jgi:hypothetical protein